MSLLDKISNYITTAAPARPTRPTRKIVKPKSVATKQKKEIAQGKRTSDGIKVAPGSHADKQRKAAAAKKTQEKKAGVKRNSSGKVTTIKKPAAAPAAKKSVAKPSPKTNAQRKLVEQLKTEYKRIGEEIARLRNKRAGVRAKLEKAGLKFRGRRKAS